MKKLSTVLISLPKNHQDQPKNDADGSRQGRRIIRLEAWSSLSSERRHFNKYTVFSGVT